MTPEIIDQTPPTEAEKDAVRRGRDGVLLQVDGPHGLQVIPRPPIDPLALVDKAIEKGVAVSELSALIDLADKVRQAKVREDYAVAVSSAQAEFPTVFKRRTATIKAREGGRDFQYQFASYDDVMREVGPVLAKYRIALNFSTEPGGGPGLLKVTCRVRVGTYSEDHTLTVPVPSQMVVNDTQKFGAALKYAMRYALCAALNIVVTDEDDDAEALVDTITEAQANEIDDLIKQKGVNLAKFLAWAQVDAVKKLPLGSLAKALDTLRRRADVQR